MKKKVLRKLTGLLLAFALVITAVFVSHTLYVNENISIVPNTAALAD